MLAAQTVVRNPVATIDVGAALERVLELFAISGPAPMLMVVEDPGAANFAAGLLPILARYGMVAVHASGEGAAQLVRLGVEALSLAEPFDAGALLAQTRPALVLLGTSEDPDAAAHDVVAACRAAHVRTLGFVDGPANVERRFRGRGAGPLAFAPDVVLVPAENLRSQLIAAGFAAERALVVEHPHFARIANERKRLDALGRGALRARLFPNRPAGRPVLVFLAERSGGLAAESMVRGPGYGLTGRGGDVRRTNIVLEEVLDAVATLSPRPYVVLRLHPKNDPQEFAAYRAEIDQVSRDEPALELVYAADAVAGLSTILLSEAAFLGRPVLSVVPRASERDWLLPPPQGEVPCVWEHAGLIAALHRMFKPVS
jgi:hypothetical protein